MNLKFWKKKAAAEGDAEAVPGALARIKAHVAALIGRIKPPPPFTAEVPASAEAGSASAEAVPASAENAAPEQDAGAGGAARRWVGVLLRMKSGLMALFWKPVALPEGEEQGDAPPARRLNLIAVGALLLALLLIAFSYAAWTIARSSPDAETDVTELIEDKHANDAPLPIIMPASAPTEMASAVLEASAVSAASAPVGLNATSAVLVTEPHTKPHTEQPLSSVMAVLPTSAVAPISPASHAPQVKAMEQKNVELQKKRDALKKEQQSSSTSVKLYPGDGKGTPPGGIATVGNSEPKAAAMTLKEAIEAMNAGENYQKKPAR